MQYTVNNTKNEILAIQKALILGAFLLQRKL